MYLRHETSDCSFFYFFKFRYRCTNYRPAATKATILLEWNLEGRTPYKNDNAYLPVPGYTCPHGVSGKITLKVIVNGDGNVVHSVPDGNTENIHPCILKKSMEYTKKARFNASSTAMQEGTITYVFAR